MRRCFAVICALAFASVAGSALGQGVTRVCVDNTGSNGSNNCVDATAANPFPVAPSPYPSFSTPVTAVATGTTGAVVGTMAAIAGKTNYLCGFDVSAIGGTAAVGPITVTGLITGSFTYELASTATGVTLSRVYSPCIPASAANTAVTVTTTADGSASAVAVNMNGFAQ